MAMLPITSVIAIDPGCSYFGYAVFRSARLVRCGRPSAASPYTLIDLVIEECLIEQIIGLGCVVVLEYPQDYPGSPKTKNLKGLKVLCDGVIKELRGAAKMHTYYPREWKAQVPKGVHHKRLQGVLSPAELELWSTANHDTRDAIGLGLYYLGRTAKGGL